MAYKEEELNLDGMVPSSGGSGSINNINLKDGDNILRILPPFGTNHRGVPFAEVNLHWFQIDEKSRRPLRCSYSTERFCPVCAEANELYVEKEALVEEFKDKGKIDWKAVPKNIGAKYKTLNDKFNALKASKGWYYNALTPSGTVGVLRLSKTAATKLGNLIVKAVKEYGFNPLSLAGGATFNFKRTKTGSRPMDVEYDVEFVQKSVKTGKGISLEIETGPVPDGVASNFEKLAYDVHTMYPVRTAQQLKRALLGDENLWSELDAEKDSKKKTSLSVKGAEDTSDGVDISEGGSDDVNPLLENETVVADEATEADDILVKPSKSSVEVGHLAETKAADEDPELAELRKTLGV